MLQNKTFVEKLGSTMKDVVFRAHLGKTKPVASDTDDHDMKVEMSMTDRIIQKLNQQKTSP